MPSKLDPRTERAARKIGDQIQRARLRAKLSQEAVAGFVGMTRTNYARIEYGKTNVTLDSLLRIADGLGLDLDVDLVRKRRSGRRAG